MVSERREPVTIELSVKELVLAIVLMACLTTAAIYSVVNFKQLRSEHQHLATSAEILREQLIQRESRLDSLRNMIEQRRGSVLVIGANSDTTEISPGAYSDRVSIEELEVQPADNNLTVSFRLVNNSQDGDIASGYLVLLAEHTSGSLNRYGTFPELDTLPGNALNYSSGDSYSIRRFKQVEAAIPLEDQLSNYNRLKVLVFDLQGELLIYQDLRLKV